MIHRVHPVEPQLNPGQQQYGAVPHTFVLGFPCPRDELCPEDAREWDCATASAPGECEAAKTSV